MHISLTPKLEEIVKNKVSSGLYNNASEVIREALRRMDQYDDLVYQCKLENLRKLVEAGVLQADKNQLVEYSMKEIIADAKKTHGKN